MASPNTIKSLAKEMLDDENLAETEEFLTARLEKHMAAKNSTRVIAVSGLIAKVRQIRSKNAESVA